MSNAAATTPTLTIVPPAPEVVEAEAPREKPHWSVMGLFVLAIAAALFLARPVLMPILFGVILAIVLSPLVDQLTRLRIPEPVGAALVMLTLAAVLVVAVELMIIPARELLAELPTQLQTLLVKFVEWLRGFRLGAWVLPPHSGKLTPEAAVQGLGIGSVLFTMAQGFVFAAVSAGILAYFLLASGSLFLTKLVRVIPSVRDKVRAVRVVRTVQREVGTYFASIALLNVGLGVAVTIMTWAYGFPMPWFWGLMVAVLNFVPYVGATTSAVCLTLAAFAFGGSSTTPLLVLMTFVCITFFEGQILNPVIVGKRLELNHTIVFVALLFWGWMWGIGGLLVAVPLLIVAKKFADHTPGLEAVSEFLAR